MKQARAAEPAIWTIAGSDSSGGAGIQADLRTFADFGLHGACAVTAVTAQSSRGVHSISPMSAATVKAQLQSLWADGPPAAVKIGMLGNSEVVATVADFLQEQAISCPVICDPVTNASDGRPLLDESGRAALQHLLPLCDVITPNVPEAEQLSGLRLRRPEDMPHCARALRERGIAAVLISGGHREFASGWVDSYWDDGSGACWLRSRRMQLEVHGSGCTLAAALAAAMAQGAPAKEAAVLAQAYVSQAMCEAVQIGSGAMMPGRVGEFPNSDSLPRVLAELSAPKLRFGDWEGERPFLYPVVDDPLWIDRLGALGIGLIQLRIKTAAGSGEQLLRQQLARGVELARRHGVRLIVNDHWRLAIELGAWGVHLGQQDLCSADLPTIAASGLRLGISTHCWWELGRALALAPSYVAVGPIFATDSKPMDFSPLGCALLKKIRPLIGSRPCVAIGGIDSNNGAEVLQAGADGLAMIAAITRAADWRQAAKSLQLLLRR